MTTAARPSDPDSTDQDRVGAFAAELRDLRKASGSPSFREMARRTNYSSSALADAAQGRRLPSRAMVEAFSTACGADPVDWVTKWKAAAAAVETAPAESAVAEPRPRRTVRATVATAAACVALGAGATVVIQSTSRQHAAATATTSPTSSALRIPSNGTDPAAAGCAADAIDLADASVLVDGAEVGVIRMVYSPLCQGGWARFAQDPGQANSLVQVSVTAPDGREAAFADPPIGTRAVYTDLLHAVGTCLTASAVLTTASGRKASASTPCVVGPH